MDFHTRKIKIIIALSFLFISFHNCVKYPGCKNRLRNMVEEFCLQNIVQLNDLTGLTEKEARELRDLATSTCLFKLLETKSEVKKCDNF